MQQFGNQNKAKLHQLGAEFANAKLHVVLTIPGNVIGENYSLLLIENADIDLTIAVLLDKVQKGKPISDDAIKMLRKRKLIEGHIPHLYVSKRIAKVTNKEVEYTLRKGFDDAECREWIIKALKDHTVLSRQQINELLWSKLPLNEFFQEKIESVEKQENKKMKRELPYRFRGIVHG